METTETRMAFFAALRADIKLPQREQEAFCRDFQALFDRYAAQGLSFAQALERVGDRPLRGFYRRPVRGERYHNLFTDAYFPLSETAFNQNVWRATVHLTEPVDPVLLQVALDLFLPDFPYFSTYLHHGFFWLDLWGMRRHLEVQPLRARPGAPLWSWGKRPLFLVEYADNRLVVEGRHALADGNGCVLSLRAITRLYLHLAGKDLPAPAPVEITCGATRFPDFYAVHGIPAHEQVPPSLRATRARHLAGTPTRLQPAGYSAIELSGEQVKALAKERSVTVTALLSAVLLLAAGDCLDPKERRGRVKLAVPVNLHQYFPLDTLRNYSMYLNLELEPEELTDFAAVLAKTAGQLREQNCRENVGAMVGGFLQVARNPILRAVPACFKWAVLAPGRILFLERRTMTLIFSNLGIIPQEFGGAVTRFGVGLSPVKAMRRKIALTTLGDSALLTLTKTTDDDRFEQALLDRLAQVGLVGRRVEP